MVKGTDWNPGTSTRIELAGSAVGGRSESTYQIPGRVRSSHEQGTGTTSVAGPSRGLSSHMLVRHIEAGVDFKKGLRLGPVSNLNILA